MIVVAKYPVKRLVPPVFAASTAACAVFGLRLSSLAFDLVWSGSRTRLAGRARLAVPDWLSEAVPDWLAEVMRPKNAPVPWGAMAQAVLALWVPMAVAFATGRRELALLPAMGGLLSVMIDNGGPYWSRVQRIGTAAVFGAVAIVARAELYLDRRIGVNSHAAIRTTAAAEPIRTTRPINEGPMSERSSSSRAIASSSQGVKTLH